MPTNPFDTMDAVTPPQAQGPLDWIFGPSLQLKAQYQQDLDAQRQRQRDQWTQQNVIAPAQALAMDIRGKNPNLSPQQVLMEVFKSPAGQEVFKQGPDAIKQLGDALNMTVPEKPDYKVAGNSVFAATPQYDPSQPGASLSIAGEGGHTETMRNDYGDVIGTDYQPGRTFGPGQQPLDPPGTYAYPSANGQTSQNPNAKWWVTASDVPGLGEKYTAAGSKYGVDPNALASQGYAESRFNPSAVSPKGARGIAQFMPATAQQYGVDPTNVDSSIDGQARYMRDMLARYQGNYRYALMAYNWGPGNVDSWLKRGANPAEVPDETVKYVRNVTGDTSALPNINYRPGMTFLKTAQATLPTNRPVQRFDLDRLGDRNPAVFFAGVGLAPFITEVSKEIGAQIDPSVAAEWTSENHVARNYLRNLSASINRYATTTGTGGGRLMAPIQAWMQLDPSAGGVINDPIDAIDTAISLYDTMSYRVQELSGKNITNTPKANLDNYEKERDAATEVLKNLPTRSQMLEMKKEFQDKQHVLTPQSFMGKMQEYIPDIVSSGARAGREILNTTLDNQPSQATVDVPAARTPAEVQRGPSKPVGWQEYFGGQ